ncbi:MAG TPA: nuclear transport factor 2 family protein [Terriglobales bacterium]|nr:nuclear transport factor 2 family protein [Terriglobales bacterium]
MKNSSAATAPAKPQVTLHASDAKDFLDKYKRAWETRDPDLAASLFTRDAHYKENPFGQPIIGRAAIHDYWAEATRRQEDIRFTVTNSLHTGYVLIAEWTCTYRDRATGKRRELAGMFFADFYGNQVRAFREYWQSRAV